MTCNYPECGGSCEECKPLIKASQILKEAMELVNEMRGI